MRKVLSDMRAQSSTAVRSGLSATPRFALAILVSLAAFFAASLRPFPLAIAAPGEVVSTPDGDAPLAIEEEGRAQCRVPGVRPPRDGRGHGFRARELTLGAVGSICPRSMAWVPFDETLSAKGSRDLAPMRRVRRHLEVMVFLT